MISFRNGQTAPQVLADLTDIGAENETGFQFQIVLDGLHAGFSGILPLTIDFGPEKPNDGKSSIAESKEVVTVKHRELILIKLSQKVKTQEFKASKKS